MGFFIYGSDNRGTELLQFWIHSRCLFFKGQEHFDPEGWNLKISLSLRNLENCQDPQNRGCQIGMQGLKLIAEPPHFCKLDVATSRIAFLDLNLNVRQVATSNS